MVRHVRAHDGEGAPSRAERARGACRAPRTARTCRASPSSRGARGSRAPRAAGPTRASTDAYGATTMIVLEPALEAEAGHAERSVLVGLVRVEPRVGRLGDAPGRARLLRRTRSCASTTSSQVCASKVPSRLRIRSDGMRYSNIVPPHDRSAGAPATCGHRPAERVPVRLGHVALHDREVAREPRLRRQEIVVVAVEPDPAWRCSRCERASARRRRGAGSPSRAPLRPRARRGRAARRSSAAARASERRRASASRSRRSPRGRRESSPRSRRSPSHRSSSAHELAAMRPEPGRAGALRAATSAPAAGSSRSASQGSSRSISLPHLLELVMEAIHRGAERAERVGVVPERAASRGARAARDRAPRTCRSQSARSVAYASSGSPRALLEPDAACGR